MAVTISGASTTVVRVPGEQVRPFKTLRILDPSQGTNGERVIVTISDIKGGGPTDAFGKLASASIFLGQTAPGTYIENFGSADEATSILQGKVLDVTGTTPTTAVVSIAV